MRDFLFRRLVCPVCRDPFRSVVFTEAGDGVDDGLLVSPCGAAFPIVDSIPRIVDDAFHDFPQWARRHRADLARHVGDSARPVLLSVADERDPAFGRAVEDTRRSFGYQWSEFSEMVCDFRDNFLNYIHPIGPDFFSGKVGLDAGVGFGRHIYHAAAFGADMIGLDLSVAIDSAHRNTRHLPNVHLVQGDIYRPPFASATFDFAYSIGVLHHLPDPRKGFESLDRLVKPGAPFFVWLYSNERRVSNMLLEGTRRVTTHLPHSLLKALCLAAAIVDWGCFIGPYKAARRLPGVGPLVERVALERIKNYSRYPFQVAWADWFDRLAAPVRFYYSEEMVRELFTSTGLHNIRVSPTGRYGWRGYGEKRRREVSTALTGA